jgi:hypothetical protein
MLRLSGVEMGYTSDPQERLYRVRGAVSVFNWMVLEWERQNSKNNVRKPRPISESTHCQRKKNIDQRGKKQSRPKMAS